jgi:guanine deaminase
LQQQLDTPHIASHGAFYADLLVWLDAMAARNAAGGTGGPFAAALLCWDGDAPRVLGVGCNHVVPTHDPSAHAEMEALRDAAAHVGHTHLADAVLVTSCECCPMCLSGALNAGIAEIIYGATRDDAAAVGFSDAAQYALFAKPLGAQCSHAHGPEAETMGAVLGEGVDAVVLVEGEDGVLVRFAADALEPPLRDGTASAALRAIRRACQALGQFHLPESTRLISRYVPHPMALVAADWARIGRRRHPEHADDPAYDDAMKVPSAMMYLNPTMEMVPTHDALGAIHQPDARAILAEITAPLDVRTIPTRQGYVGQSLAFAQWQAMLDADATARY